MVASTPNYREAGYLLSAYGRRLGLEGDDAGAQQTLAIAAAVAKHEGDSTLEMVTLIDAAAVDTHHLRLQESGEKGRRALALMEQLDEAMRGQEALFHVMRIPYNMGEPVEARRYATVHLGIAEQLEDPVLLTSAFYANEKLAALGGDWASARQFCEGGLRSVPPHYFHLSIRAMLEYATGDFKQAEAYLDRLIEVFRVAEPEPGVGWIYVAVPQAIAAIAQITGATKYFEVAQAAAQTVLKSQRVSPLLVWFARTGLALMAAQVGDTRTVQEQYRAVRGQRGNFMTMDVDRVLGLLAAASGEMDQAAAFFEAALATWSKGRYPEYAWTAYEYADMLLKRGNPEEQDRANALLDEALSISRELGMIPLTERVLLRKEGVNT
jgi:tetratricopeptide (TPR) repeat protein